MEELLNHIKNYFNLKVKIISLLVKEKASKASAILLSIVIVLVLILAFLFFASIGLALFISELIGYAYSGFAIMAGFFLFVLIIVLSFKKSILYKPIANIFVRMLTKNDNS
ncbi:MAG: hypothetical protein ACQPRH_02115 [Solitalea-like symbiont of Tyrophagus putrescentiae]